MSIFKHKEKEVEKTVIKEKTFKTVYKIRLDTKYYNDYVILTTENKDEYLAVLNLFMTGINDQKVVTLSTSDYEMNKTAYDMSAFCRVSGWSKQVEE